MFKFKIFREEVIYSEIFWSDFHNLISINDTIYLYPPDYSHDKNNKNYNRRLNCIKSIESFIKCQNIENLKMIQTNCDKIRKDGNSYIW